MTLNYPGCPCFGMIESGELWYGPSTCSINERGKGPRHLPLAISLQTMVRNSESKEVMETLLGGDCVLEMGGKLITKP